MSLSNNKKFYRLSIILPVIIAGACLRLYGIDFGLPDLLHLDEPFEIHRALKLATGFYDFERAGKGGLYFIIFIELVFSFIFLYITGATPSPQKFAFFFVSHEDTFYLIARVTSALMGILSLYIIYKIGKRNGGNLTGLIALLLLSVSGLHVQNSHYATVDITLVLFLLLTWYYLFAIIQSGEKRNFCLAGLFGGLSLITKLPAVVIFAPIFLVGCICFFRRNNMHTHFRKYSVIMLLIFIVVTFAGEPGYIKLVHGIQYRISVIFGTSDQSDVEKNLAEEGLSLVRNINLYKYYTEVIVKDVGLPVSIIFLLSIVYFLRRRSFIEILILSFVIPYMIVISSTSTVLYYKRYTLPVIILIIITASRSSSYFIEYLKPRIQVRTNKDFIFNVIVFLMVIFVSYPNALNAINVSSKFGRDSTKIEAKKWIIDNIHSRATIMMEGSAEHRSQYLVPLVNSKENIKEVIEDLRKRYPGKAKYWELRNEYLDSSTEPRYDLLFIRKYDQWMDYDSFKKSGIEYVVIDYARLKKLIRTRDDHMSSQRVEFYEKLKNDPVISEIARFVKDDTRFGGEIVIFRNTTSKDHHMLKENEL